MKPSRVSSGFTATLLALVLPNIALADPVDGLVAHWTFDTDANSSVGNWNATVNGTGSVGYRSAVVGTGSYSATGSGFLQTNLPGSSGNDTRSVSVWFSTNPSTGSVDALWGWGSNGTGDRYDFRFEGSDLKLEIGWGAHVFPLSKSVFDRQWHHALLTYSGGNLSGHKLYIDGQLAGTASGSNTIQTAGSAVRIGTGFQRSQGGNPTIRDFSGRLDDFGLFNTTLSATDAVLIYGLGQMGISLSELQAARDLWAGPTGGTGTISGRKWIKTNQLQGTIGEIVDFSPGHRGFVVTGSSLGLAEVPKEEQSITFAPLPERTMGDPPFTLAATASSGLPVSYTSSDQAIATVSGNTLTLLNPGTTIITAIQEGNDDYLPTAPVTQSLVVVRATRISQTIDFPPLPAITSTAPPFDLQAVASSGLAVDFESSNPNVATVEGNRLTIVGSGTTTVTAVQPGNIDHEPAAMARDMVVTPATQTIAFAPLAAQVMGNRPLALSATASSGLAVVYTSSDPSVARIDGTILTILSPGTTTITVSQAGDQVYAPAEPVSHPVVIATAANELLTNPSALELTARSGESVSAPLQLTHGLAASVDWEATITGDGSAVPNLEAAVAAIAGSGDVLHAPLPDRFDFSGAGWNLLFYDYANIFSTDLGGPLTQSNNQVLSAPELGPSGRYTTVALPGLFLFAGDLDGVEWLQVDGKYSESVNARQAGTFVVEGAGRRWSAFYCQTRLRGGHTANQVFLVDQLDATHDLAETYKQFHQVRNLAGKRRLYYAFFATDTVTLQPEDVFVSLAQRLLSTVPTDSSAFFSIAPDLGSVAPGTASTVDFHADAVGVVPGDYRAQLTLLSPDGNRLADVPVTLHVQEARVQPSRSILRVVSVPGGPVDTREVALVSPLGSPQPWTAEVTAGASWLELDTTSGQTPDVLPIRIAPGDLEVGVYQGAIRISSGPSSAVLPVVLQIDPLEPVMLRADLLRPQLYALNNAPNSGSVLVVSAHDGAITKVIPIGTNPRDCSFSQDGGFLYTADFESSRITEIDLTTLEVTRSREVEYGESPGASGFTVATGNDGVIFHTDATDDPGLKVLDFDSGTTLSSFTLPHWEDGIGAMWFDNLQDRLYFQGRRGTYEFARIGSLDTTTSPPTLIGFGNGIGWSSGIKYPTIIAASLNHDRLFTLRGRFVLPSMEVIGDVVSDTKAGSAYGHLLANKAGIHDSDTYERLASFPVGADFLDFTMGQDAVVLFNSESDTFEVFPLPQDIRPPAIGLVPSPPPGGVLSPDSPILSWSGLPHVDGYRVFVGTDRTAVEVAGPGAPEDRGVVRALSLELNPPYPLGTAFYWRIDAIRGGVPIPGTVNMARMTPFRASPEAISLRLPRNTGPQPVSIGILDAADVALGWSTSSNVPWFTPSAPSGLAGQPLTGTVDATGLESGTHTGLVTISSGQESIGLPLAIEIYELNLVRMTPDPSRSVVYGLHTGDPLYDESQILAIDSPTGTIRKALPMGRNATEFEIDPVADRLYLISRGEPSIRVVDLSTFTELPPIQTTRALVDLEADYNGRLVVQHLRPGSQHSYESPIILDTTTGEKVGEAGGLDGTFVTLDPRSNFYYIEHIGDLVILDLGGSEPTTVSRIEQTTGGTSLPPLLSSDGGRLFWDSLSCITPSTLIARLPGEAIATNHDGEIAVGESEIWWSDSGAVAATLAFSSPVSAIDFDDRHLVRFHPAGGTVSSTELSTLVLLPGPRPKPQQTIPQSEFSGLSWPAPAGAEQYHVYFGTDEAAVTAATPGSQAHVATVSANSYVPDSLPPYGHRYYWRIDVDSTEGIEPGNVRYFDIPFPLNGEPFITEDSSFPENTFLNLGGSLLASTANGFLKVLSPIDGTLALEQQLGGFASSTSTPYSHVAAAGQEWIFRELDDDLSPDDLAAVTTYSRGHHGFWRERETLNLSDPSDVRSSVATLDADGGLMLAGLFVSQPKSPGRVLSYVEWPSPTPLGSFQASDAVDDDLFGQSIAIEGNRALIGAPQGITDWPNRTGRAYIFEFNPESRRWLQRAKLQPTTDRDDRQGMAVALGDELAALSTGWYNPVGPGRKVHIYRRSPSGSWSLMQTIDNPDPNSSRDSEFGYSMAFYGDILFVGARSLIYVYRLQDGQWIQSAPILDEGRTLAVRDGVLYSGSRGKVSGYRLEPVPNHHPRFSGRPPALLVAGRSASFEILADDADGGAGLVIVAKHLPNGLRLDDHGDGRATLAGIPTATAGSKVFAQWSVTDPTGATTYQNALLEVIAPEDVPVFQRLPESVDVAEGERVTLRASVDDDEAVTWQWSREGNPIPGATLPYLELGEASAADAGSYSVTAANVAGSARSPSAILQVRPPSRDGGDWGTFGNDSSRSGHHPATLGRVTFVPAWSRTIAPGDQLLQPAIGNGRIFTGKSDRNPGPVQVLDLQSGNELTRYQMPTGASNAGAPSWFDGRFFVHYVSDSGSDGLVCVDDQTGAEVWTSAVAAQHDARSHPAITNAGVFHCAAYLYGIEPDGVRRFYHGPPFGTTALASVHDGRIFTFYGRTFREHHPAGGSVIWDLTLEDISNSSERTCAISGDSALFFDAGDLLCIDTNNRALRWRISGGFGGIPAAHGGKAYAIHSGGVTACSLEDGTVIAEFSTPASVSFHRYPGQQPVLLNDHLIVSGKSASWVFNLDSGQLVQTIPAAGQLAYSRSHLLAAGEDGVLRAFFANAAPEFTGTIPKSVDSGAATPDLTTPLAPFALDPDPDDPLVWSIVSVTRLEIFRTLELDPVTGNLTVVYNPWQSGTSDVVISIADSVGNITETTLSFSVPEHPAPQLDVADALILNRQTGLYDHTVTITNRSAREIAGFDLTISGLPASVTVHNASGNSEAGAVVHHRQPLAAGATVTLLLEYHALVRGTVIDPNVAVSLVTGPEAAPVAPDGGLAVDRCMVQEDGSTLIEFRSTPGALYEIHYSEDGSAWKLSPTRVRAAGNRVQWIDRGPPRTDTAPSTIQCRLYRVLEVPEAGD